VGCYFSLDGDDKEVSRGGGGKKRGAKHEVGSIKGSKARRGPRRKVRGLGITINRKTVATGTFETVTCYGRKRQPPREAWRC